MTVGDKVKHFTAYFILGGYLTVAFSVQERVPVLRKYFIIAAILVATLYGLIDEIHQAFIPGRFYELLDWVADITGATIGSLIVGLTLKKYVFNKKRWYNLGTFFLRKCKKNERLNWLYPNDFISFNSNLYMLGGKIGS